MYARWPARWRVLWHRVPLRRAALRYAGQGWPVLPGAFLLNDRYVCGPLCPTVACHPAIDRWESVASAEESDVDQWWASAPFSVLLPTGHGFDAIEVSAHLGQAARADLGPVISTPSGRWMYLVRAGDGLRPELATRLDVVLHGRGSWIPAPPTRTPNGRVRWEVHPATVAWQLPDPYAVQQVLVKHLTPRRVATFASTSMTSAA
jgi:hypothetical protein